MKRIILILCFVSGMLLAQSPSKYFIYLKDKGEKNEEQLSKNSPHYIEAINSLSERSIARRIKNLGDDFITYEDLPLNRNYTNAIEKTGAKIVWKLKWFNAVSAYLTKAEVGEISKFKFVSKIVPVMKLKYKQDITDNKILNKTSNEENTNYKYNYGSSLTQYELSDVPFVHDLGFNGSGVIIGILDAGFAWRTHSALKNNDVIAERDFVYGDSDTDDGDASHGTAVFSLMAGFKEGNIIGPAFGAKFILAKTEDIRSETHVEEDNYAAALEWMDSIGVDITSSSLGYSEFDDGEGDYTYSDMDGKTTIVTKATEIAFSKGIVTITSAGNEGNNGWRYITAPGDGFNIITVGAVNSSREIASFSSVGPTFDGRIKPEVVAQGVSCYHATAYNDSYGFGSGTSYSAPIVAGITGQLLSAYPFLNNRQVRRILIESCDSADSPNNFYGYGLLSSKSAIEFPNIHITDNSEYIINKMISDTAGVSKDSAKLFFSINSLSNLFSGKMTYDSLKKYFSSVSVESINPGIQNGDTLHFFFEYLDGNNIPKRVPQNENYKVVYNSLDVTLGGKLLPSDPEPIPNEFDLTQNFPNPFNPQTEFQLIIPNRMFVTLNIYNILGVKIKTLASKEFAINTYNFVWDGTNDAGGKVSSGVYIYSAISKDKVLSRKMMFLK